MKGTYLTGVLAVFLFMSLAAAFSCPYTGAPLPTPYSDVTILPVEKYVGEPLDITILDVDVDGDRMPARDRIIIFYYIINEEVVSEYSLYTNKNGKAEFIPEESGRYGVATSARYIFFDALSQCGDNRCSFDEDRVSCPSDCGSCGDDVCDIGEDKQNCPKDCIICGDSACDAGENRNNCAKDCATCGDGVCDLNENKIACPEDCVICGDDVCDALELTSLHETSCPDDCTICGDDYCDDPPENETTCPQDCANCGDDICDEREDASICPEDCLICGDGICDAGENETCFQDCTICGDGFCNGTEDKANCPEDCLICGDNVCDKEELVGLHDTICPEDCAVCGDNYCDSGESRTCEEDCEESAQGLFIGYFLIPLVIAIIIIIFELSRHYATRDSIVGGGRRGPKLPRVRHMELTEVMPYFIVLIISLLLGGMFLAIMDISYENNLAIFDLGAFLLNNGVIISLLILFLGAGLGMVARATYFMERTQAISLTLVSTFLGMLPVLLIFLNAEAVVLLAGTLVGALVAMATVKKEESELAVKKPFKVGADFADRMLFIAAIFVCLSVFLQVYLSDDMGDKLASSIWKSEVSKDFVRDNYGPQSSKAEIRNNVVEPFFESNKGGLSGKMIFAIAVTILLLAILKLFITIIKILAGFFSWMLDKSGFI